MMCDQDDWQVSIEGYDVWTVFDIVDTFVDNTYYYIEDIHNSLKQRCDFLELFDCKMEFVLTCTDYDQRYRNIDTADLNQC